MSTALYNLLAKLKGMSEGSEWKFLTLQGILKATSLSPNFAQQLSKVWQEDYTKSKGHPMKIQEALCQDSGGQRGRGAKNPFIHLSLPPQSTVYIHSFWCNSLFGLRNPPNAARESGPLSVWSPLASFHFNERKGE